MKNKEVLSLVVISCLLEVAAFLLKIIIENDYV